MRFQLFVVHINMMARFAAILLFLQIGSIWSAQRWMYTGSFKPDPDEPVPNQWFHGYELPLSQLFDVETFETKKPLLYSGNFAILPDHDPNSILEAKTIQYLIKNISFIDSKSPEPVNILSAYNYGIHGMRKYGSISDLTEDNSTWSLAEEEIGLYDTVQHFFIERNWRLTRFGALFAIQFETLPANCQQTLVDETQLASCSNDKVLHKVLFTIDLYRRPSVIYHTSSQVIPWQFPASAVEGMAHSVHPNDVDMSIEADGTVHMTTTSTESIQEAPEDHQIVLEHTKQALSQAQEETTQVQKRLRVMTYNLWNNNPPSWVYTFNRQRWARYDQRMKHFADIIVDINPDILTVQEVRIDSSFYGPEISFFLEDFFTELKKPDGGNQVEHLMSKLQVSWKERYGNKAQEEQSQQQQQQAPPPYPNYQIVYQPAMHMVDSNLKPNDRNDEGCLIISRYPIAYSTVAFLPRDIGNPQDDHQRILLIAQVQVPMAATTHMLVTVVTSHWSLLFSSRDIAAKHVFDVLNQHPVIKQSSILTGDLNAEPMEASIQYITTSPQQQQLFVDSWDYSIKQQQPLLSQEEYDRIGYTFPACSPVKRIDFIFVRNFTADITTDSSSMSSQKSRESVEIVDSFVAGKHPTRESEHLMNSRDGIGMNDMDSPLWASDHFALVTDLILTRTS